MVIMSNTSIPIDQDEIVTINAGGRILQILKSTVSVAPEDSGFHKLFNGNGSNNFAPNHNTVLHRRDADGNIFLDFDPELIEIVLNFLRMKKIEDPCDPIVEPPAVPKGKTKYFKRILNHFGLTAFFYYPSSVPMTTTTTPSVPIQNIRKMSLGNHDDVSEPTANIIKSYHDSFSFASPEDASIAEGFEYCYG